MLLVIATAAAVTLEEAWTAAAENSLDLQLVHESVVQTETYKGQALALVAPKLVLGGHWTYNEYEIAWDMSSLIPEEFADFFDAGEPIVFQKQSYFDANASIVQPLFSGRAIPLLQGAGATIKAQRVVEEGAKSQVKAGVAKVYYGLAVARAGEALAQKAVVNTEKHLAMVETRLAAGVVAPTAKLQAQIALSRAQRSVAEAHEGVVTAAEAFARLTGLPAESTVDLPAPRELPYADADAAVARALQQRPSIRAAQYNAKAAGFADTASKMTWLPTLDGRFTYSWTENNVGFNTDPTFWQIVLTADWVLWDGGFRLAEGKQYASQKRQASLAIESEELKAKEEIHALYATFARATTALTTVEQESVLAEENLRIAEIAYKAGTIDFLTLEDARLGAEAAQMTILTERMKRDLASYDLLAATGDL